MDDSSHLAAAGGVAHWGQMGSRIHSRYQAGEFTDFTLKAGDDSFRCHKIILSAASDYLHGLFLSGMKEAVESVLELPMTRGEMLGQVVNFIYSGHIQLEADTVEDIVKVADILQLSGLKDCCLSFMVDNLDADNCIGVHAFAKLYQLPVLQSKAWKFMQGNFTEVTQGQEFKLLSAGELVEYVEDDGLMVPSEDVILEAVVAWLHHDPERREEDILDILLHVRLAHCSSSLLIKQLNHTYMDNVKCRQLLNEALDHCVMQDGRYSYECPKLRAPSLKGLMVIGGVERSGQRITACSLLNTSQSSWTSVTYFPSTHILYSVCRVDSGFLITGGHPDTKRCLRYTYSSNRWDELPRMKHNRYHHASAILGDTVYVCGGIHNDKPISSVECLDLTRTEKRAWKEVDPLPEACTAVQLAVYNGCLYKFGGIGSSTDRRPDYPKSYKLASASACWMKLHDMPEVCRGGTAVVLADNIFLVGGFYEKKCLRYTPDTDTWIALTAPDLRHEGGSAVMWQGNILVSGGKTSNQKHSSTDVIEAYAPTADTWSVWKYRLTQPLSGHFMFVI